MSSDYSILDLFAGAGGLSEGFFQRGFDFVAHVEMNHYASMTIETRSLYHKLLQNGRKDIYDEYYLKWGDISARKNFLEQCSNLNLADTGVMNEKITFENEMEIINNVKQRMKSLGHKGLDVIIGGPPCQAYSLIGRGRDPHRMANDPRNELYLHYLTFLQKLKPRLFVFENVPGIKSAKKGCILSDFENKILGMGYEMDSKVLNAADFGVLQNRKRVIIIGWKKSHDLEYPEFEKKQPNGRVWDILEDLPFLEPGDGIDGAQEYAIPPSEYLKNSGIRTDEKAVLNHKARKHNDRDREIYRLAIEKWNKLDKRLHYTEIPSELRTHTNVTSFLDRFKVVDGNGYSHSIVSHLSKDGHYFIHPDINQARSFTVREAARVQSFPDNYIFEGPRTAQYIQIGNAVPPIMAEGIAAKINKMLDET